MIILKSMLYYGVGYESADIFMLNSKLSNNMRFCGIEWFMR